MFHLLLIVPPILVAGAFAAAYALDLEFVDAAIHYALYVLVTVVLCLLIGINLLACRHQPRDSDKGTGSVTSGIGDIPEIQGLDRRQHLIRIPPECDVPITPRVRQLIDTAEFRRLGRISQLGLVSLVYPAAHHTRFEHSLGVYRLALLYLKQLCA